MKPEDLILELSKNIETSLARDLVHDFIELQGDCKTRTLGRSSFGKFVETVVQVLEYFDTGKYDKKPKVDSYLKSLEHSSSSLPDDLKLCCSRIARSIYTLRNKRNILHKGDVDPNIYDLNYIYSACQWILSEMIRYSIKSDKALAGRMLEYIQIPISVIVEEFSDRRIVYGNLSVKKEALVLLHSHYPEPVSLKEIQKSMERRSKSAISNILSKLWNEKLVHRDAAGYKLTQPGFRTAVAIITGIDG